ncbi:MAG: GHKL domain-containing protein [Lachnospiraceae bacterium]|nr:GHKL domain-containing protein [Lachnospiraceae bacterium]
MEMLYAFVVYEYFKTFFTKRTIGGIYLYTYILCVGVQGIAINLIPDDMAYCRMILVTALLLGISLFYKGSMIGKVIFSLLFVAMSMLGELLIACIFVACDISIPSNSQAGYFITYSLLLILIKGIRYYINDAILGEGSWKTSFKIILLPIASMFLAYRIFFTQYELGIRGIYWKTIVSIIILLGINIIMFEILTQLSENMELKRKAALYEREFILLEQHMHERENLMKEFRMKRHDLKHQMLNLLMLLHDKEYEKLEEDIERLAELDSLNGLFLVNTENSIIDAFVNSKYAFAREHGIKFNAKMNIPAELPFAGEDISVILGNALDNAMEACLRGEVDNPYVNLNMLYDQGNLVIIVENAFDGFLKKEWKGGWGTRKDNSQQHGIGIQSIRNVIRKYHGYYHVDIKEKVYHLEMILYSHEI